GVAVAGLTRITTAEPGVHTPIVSGHIVEGRAGTGRIALAAKWAGRSGLGALRLEAQAARQPDAVAAAALTARLEQAALILDTGAMPDPQPLVGLPPDVPTALLSERARGWPAMLAPRLTQVEHVRPAPAADRVTEWQSSLDAAGLTTTAQARRDVAERFRLSHAAIVRATQRAAALSENATAGPGTLARAARAEARGDLDGVADRVPLQPDWNDLVLPAGARTQLEDFTNAVAHRDRVFADWGFAGKGAAKGLGLTALFAGISGTGKTMAAAVIAKTLGFDLWQVNLAGLVSKYVGETEKNLDRVFGTAGAADAILFFDEADALFGKRSEVRDSHDRYANIETAFLLQRLEDHDGPVILATNLARNIDAAFLRRLFVMVEFPAPDLSARTALWAGAFPDAAPLAGDVEPEDLARLHTTLTGGDIRAAALEAAFLAAAGTGQIDAHTLNTAVQRQMIKRGRLPAAPPPR
ncbi:MAG: ATP-binding protein, partial [Pseudomonadota bacterium]